MIAGLALLVAAAAADVVQVRTASDVAALCEAMPLTELQVRRYEAVVPARGLELAEGDAPAGRLVLRDGAELLAPDGATNLYQMLDRGLPTEVDAPAARRVRAAKEAGTLTLTVQFELPEEMTCTTRLGTTTRAVPIVPVAWTSPSPWRRTYAFGSRSSDGRMTSSEGAVTPQASSAARQIAFMCVRAQSAKLVNPPGTRALAAAM